jgi:hypothetical protein
MDRRLVSGVCSKLVKGFYNLRKAFLGIFSNFAYQNVQKMVKIAHSDVQRCAIFAQMNV